MTEEHRAYAMPQERTDNSWSAVHWSRFHTHSPDILCIFSEGRFHHVNPAWTRVMGYSQEEMQGHSWQEFIHPEDKEATIEAIQKFREGAFPDHFENRYRHRDGSYRWLLWSIAALAEENLTYASALDVTEWKKTEAETRNSRRFLQRLMDTVPNIVYIYDHIGQHNVYCNHAIEEVLGYSPEQFQSCNGGWMALLMHPEDIPRFVKHQKRLTSLPDGVRVEFEYRMRHADGDWRWLNSHEMVFMRAASGDVRQVLGSALDVTERKHIEQMAEMRMLELSEIRVELEAQQQALLEANAQLEALATTDGLTGLKNHRAFQEFLEQEFQRSVRYQLPLSLLLLDVDRFKQYNDTYGHPAGDEVLKAVGVLLREHTRATDFVARYGGEEFVLILPQTCFTEALPLAERLRVAIESAAWPYRPITASIGLATKHLATQDRALMIAEADSALYLSKQSGRNRVTAFGESPVAASVPPTA